MVAPDVLAVSPATTSKREMLQCFGLEAYGLDEGEGTCLETDTGLTTCPGGGLPVMDEARAYGRWPQGRGTGGCQVFQCRSAGEGVTAHLRVERD
jgi:hypothetical protein